MTVIELDEDQFEAKIVAITLQHKLQMPLHYLVKVRGSGCFHINDLPKYIRKEPLSPLWETFVTEIWHPVQQRFVDLHAEGELPGLTAERLAIAREGLKLTAADWSNEEVNHHRATKYLKELVSLREEEGDLALGRRWWPTDVLGIVEAIKKEQQQKTLKEEEDAKRLAEAQRPVDAYVEGKVFYWLKTIEGAPDPSTLTATGIEGMVASYVQHIPQFKLRHERGIAQTWSIADTDGRDSHHWPEETPSSTTRGKRKRQD